MGWSIFVCSCLLTISLVSTPALRDMAVRVLSFGGSLCRLVTVPVLAEPRVKMGACRAPCKSMSREELIFLCLLPLAYLLAELIYVGMLSVIFSAVLVFILWSNLSKVLPILLAADVARM